MTREDAIAHLESRVGRREETGVQPGDVDDWIETALHRVTEKNAMGPHKADFQGERQLTLVDGVVAVPTDMLPGYISRITGDGLDVPFELKKNRTEFAYMLCREFPLAAVEAKQIYCEGTDPSTPLNINILATGIVVPDLDNLLTKYDDDFYDELAKVFGDRPKVQTG